jgi:Sigma-70, region 4
MRKESIDLGLALLSVLRLPNESLTYDDIAAWCGCCKEQIRQIEFRALRKLRRRIQLDASGADHCRQELAFRPEDIDRLLRPRWKSTPRAEKWLARQAD